MSPQVPEAGPGLHQLEERLWGWMCFSEKEGCCGCVRLQRVVNGGTRVQW